MTTTDEKQIVSTHIRMPAWLKELIDNNRGPVPQWKYIAMLMGPKPLVIRDSNVSVGDDMN